CRTHRSFFCLCFSTSFHTTIHSLAAKQSGRRRTAYGHQWRRHIMKKAVKILLGIALVLVCIVVGGVAYLSLAFPKVKAAPAITLEPTPEMIEHGRYLANH